jgi:hypothetical protein
MKKSLAIFSLFILTIQLYAQIVTGSSSHEKQYQVELYYKFECNGKIEKIDFFTLGRDGREYSSTNGSCIVLQQGEYSVYHYGIDNLENAIISVQTNFQTDTILVYKIYLDRMNAIPPWPYYSFCGKPCNGEIIEKWSNGNVRISGNFDNGKIIQYNQYDKNDILKKRIINTKLKSLYETYENGKLIFKIKRVLIFGSAKIWDEKNCKYVKGTYYQFKH